MLEIFLIFAAFILLGPIAVLLWMKYVGYLLDKFKW